MNTFAVTAMASVLPEGEHIEAFNRLIYDGLAVRGNLPDELLQAELLLAALVKQLRAVNKNATEISATKEAFIFITDSDESAFKNYRHHCNCHNLSSALQAAKDYLQKGMQQVHVLAIDMQKVEQSTLVLAVDTPAVHFSQQENFEINRLKSKQCNGALALTLALPQANLSYFALIEAFASRTDISSQNISHCIRECMQQAAFNTLDIGYLELSAFAHEQHIEMEIAACKNVYCKKSDELTIALGAVASSISYPTPLYDMAALLKVILLCYHRYLAGVPEWTQGKHQEHWMYSSFYVTSESKSWFVSDVDTPRVAALSLFHKDATTYSHVLVSDRGVSLERQNCYFAYSCPHCVPFAGNSATELLQGIHAFKNAMLSCNNEIQIRALARQAYQSILDEEDALNIKSYRAVILGHNQEQLLSEIALFEAGIFQAFEDKTKIHWELKTPKGSYLTAKPLGEGGKLAFVFPGLGSSYVGLGQDIFQLFPSIFKESFRFTKNVGEELQEKVLYPRRQQLLSFREKRQLDMEIVLNLKDVGKTDTTYSSICAHIMTHVFQVRPDMAFGYSMGEANMMTALEVWKNPTLLESRFRESDIFKNKLYGRLETVRKLWNIDNRVPSENLWTTFTLKASQAAVAECIQQEKIARVFVTLINTDDNVVIAGDPFACMALIQKLACRAIPMGFVPAIHSPPTYEQYEGIAELYSLECNESCSSKLYSSSCYLPVPFRSKAIAYAIAKCFCEPVDFPRLVNRVYDDGARIFLEAGAGRTCSTWIDKILLDKEHVIVPLNVKGTADSVTFTRVLAKLFCHKVDVNLHPLYENIF